MPADAEPLERPVVRPVTSTPGPLPGPMRLVGGEGAAGGSRSDADAERRHLEAVQRDLAGQFPSLPAHHVSAVVERIWAGFHGARIRDYVPVLVRKQARAELRDHIGLVAAVDGVASEAIGLSVAEAVPDRTARPEPSAGPPLPRTVRFGLRSKRTHEA